MVRCAHLAEMGAGHLFPDRLPEAALSEALDQVGAEHKGDDKSGEGAQNGAQCQIAKDTEIPNVLSELLCNPNKHDDSSPVTFRQDCGHLLHAGGA